MTTSISFPTTRLSLTLPPPPPPPPGILISSRAQRRGVHRRHVLGTVVYFFYSAALHSYTARFPTQSQVYPPSGMPQELSTGHTFLIHSLEKFGERLSQQSTSLAEVSEGLRRWLEQSIYIHCTNIPVE